MKVRTTDDGRPTTDDRRPAVDDGRPSTLVSGQPPVVGRRSPMVIAIVLLALLAAGVSLLLNLTVPQPVFKDDMPGGPYHYEGMFDPPGNSYGYFDEEIAPTGESYKWTTGHAYTTFPYAANGGRYIDVSIRMGAFQATAQSPISAEVELNGQPFSHLMVAGPFQVYTMRLDTKQTPDPYLDPAHVQIDILADTRTAGQDPRHLGVAVDWIEVHPVKGTAEIALEAAVWALSLLAVALLALLRVGLRWSLIFVCLTLLSFVVLHLTYMPRSIDVATEIGLAGTGWLLAALLAPRRLPLAGLAIATSMLWVVVAGRLFGDWQMDDAFISYRYAANLVHGYGLVYNPGEPVEGYTNFLWTLLAAAAIKLGWNPQSVAQAANMLVNQCIIVLAFVASRRLVATTDHRPPTTIFSSPPRRQVPPRSPRFLSFLNHKATESTESTESTEVDESSLFQSPVVGRPSSIVGRPEFAWPLLILVLMTVDVSLVFYGAKGSGMESASFALMVMLAFVLLWSNGRTSLLWLRIGAGVALAAGALLRPEGLFIAAPVLLLVRAWQDWRSGLPVWRLLGWALLPFFLIIVPYEIWRVGFYGYPFPNTFYAKTGLTVALIERGLVYVASFAAPHWLIAVPAFLGAVVWIIAWIRSRRAQATEAQKHPDAIGMLAALFLLTAIYTLYIIWVGGDHFPAMRFFVPLLVPMALLAQETLRRGVGLLSGNRRVSLAATGLLALAVVVYAAISLWMQTDAGPLGQRGNRETTAWERWGSAALWLREETPPDTTLAAFAAGAMSYFSDRYTIDMLGLNDVHIAHVQVPDMGQEVAGHEKQDPPYVLARKPDYILGTWQDYFSPIAGQLMAHYGFDTVDAPTGTPVKWLRRNDAKGP